MMICRRFLAVSAVFFFALPAVFGLGRHQKRGMALLVLLAAAHTGFADRDDLGFVLIAHRQVQYQVHVAAQSEAGELAFEGFRRICGLGGGHIAAKWRSLA